MSWSRVDEWSQLRWAEQPMPWTVASPRRSSSLSLSLRRARLFVFAFICFYSQLKFKIGAQKLNIYVYNKSTKPTCTVNITFTITENFHNSYWQFILYTFFLYYIYNYKKSYNIGVKNSILIIHLFLLVNLKET